jgi:hypothetical protein
VFFTKYYYRDEIKDDEMGVACSTHEKFKKCAHNFSKKTGRKTSLEGRIVLKWISDKLCVAM